MSVTLGGEQGTHRGRCWPLHHSTCSRRTRAGPRWQGRGSWHWSAKGGHLPVVSRVALPGLMPWVPYCRSQTSSWLPACHRLSRAGSPLTGHTRHPCARRSKPLRVVCPVSFCKCPSLLGAPKSVHLRENDPPWVLPRLHGTAFDSGRAACGHGLAWLPASQAWGPPSDSTVFAALGPVWRACSWPPAQNASAHCAGPSLPHFPHQGLCTHR